MTLLRGCAKLRGNPALICPVSSIHTLITDAGIAPEMQAGLEEKGITVIQA